MSISPVNENNKINSNTPNVPKKENTVSELSKKIIIENNNKAPFRERLLQKRRMNQINELNFSKLSFDEKYNKLKEEIDDLEMEMIKNESQNDLIFEFDESEIFNSEKQNQTKNEIKLSQLQKELELLTVVKQQNDELAILQNEEEERKTSRRELKLLRELYKKQK